MNGKTILYVIVDDTKTGVDEPKMVAVGEITEGATFTAEPDETAEDVPTPTATFTLTMNVKMECMTGEERNTRHLLKEQAMLGWRPEPTRPPARPRRPHGRPYWFRIRSFCVRRGWH